MRLTIFCLVLLICCVLSKTVTKALTESMGQEVIEMGAPLKDLPAELEEEPSLEKDDEDTPKAPAPAATKAAQKIPAAAGDGRRKMKDIDRIDSVNQEEDEQRVEKELQDVYKDSDYKADSNELKTSGEAGNALRQRNQKGDFVFAPKNINDPKEVERFRTSPDYIDCKKKKLSDVMRALKVFKDTPSMYEAEDMILGKLSIALSEVHTAPSLGEFKYYN